MNKKIIFGFIFMMALASSFVLAQDLNNFSFKQIECMSILPFKSEIIGQAVPEEVPISDEIVNIYIDNEIYGYIEIKEKTIQNLNCLENESATYDLLIESEGTISDIASSDAPFDKFVEKFKDGEIKLKGKTFGKSIKAFFIKIGIKWFF